MDISERLDYLKAKFTKLDTIDSLNFGEFINPLTWRTKWLAVEPKIKQLHSAGCYIIYESNSNQVIYVGFSGQSHKIRNRINDLFSYAPSIEKPNINPFFHSLTEKLTKSFGSIEKVRDFYINKCYFKIINTETDAEAIALEGLLIWTLNPKYNKEIIKGEEAKVEQKRKQARAEANKKIDDIRRSYHETLKLIKKVRKNN